MNFFPSSRVRYYASGVASGAASAAGASAAASATGAAASATATFVPYTGATGPVNLGAYDLMVNGITAGRGKSGVSTNAAFGAGALNSNTTAIGNSAFGYGAMNYNTTGSWNSAFGSNSMVNNRSIVLY